MTELSGIGRYRATNWYWPVVIGINRHVQLHCALSKFQNAKKYRRMLQDKK